MRRKQRGRGNGVSWAPGPNGMSDWGRTYETGAVGQHAKVFGAKRTKRRLRRRGTGRRVGTTRRRR